MSTPANFAGVKPSIDGATLWPNPIPPVRVEFVLECLADFGLETLPGFQWTEWRLSIGLIALALTLPGFSREGESCDVACNMDCY